ncbi:hypothetical protein [Legionella sp. CNM-4043-24]|uniref:hypothetical protein n=1 Tax=Legionella sp. CNM-4043-24 TaxID=3421646 RepID=UPI00403AFCBC
MSNKQFAERLNRELDSIDAPDLMNERVAAFAKLLRIPKFQAEAILNGNMVPNRDLLAILAQELDVREEWLLGKSDQRH